MTSSHPDPYELGYRVFSTPWQEKLVDFQGLKTWTRAIGKQPKRNGFFGKRTDR